MRFLGKRIRTDFSGEVVSRFRDRPEGLRIKHALDLNSVKLYDKQGSVLRVETTIQRARVCAATGQRKATPTALSSGVRSVVASQTCIVVPSSPRTPMSATSTLSPLVIPQPHSVDSSLASAKNSMEWLHPPSSSPLGRSGRPTPRRYFPWRVSSARLSQQGTPCLALSRDFDEPLETRRLSGRVTRLIRILRAHRLVKKVPKTFRYRLTSAVSNFAPHYLPQTLSPLYWFSVKMTARLDVNATPGGRMSPIAQGSYQSARGRQG